MNIPLVTKNNYDLEQERCMNDLLYNANSNEYCNERGFKQKLIDLLYNLGYYSSNETIFVNKNKE